MEKNEHWWRESVKNPHEALLPLIKKIEEHQQQEMHYAKWISLLHNRKWTSLKPFGSQMLMALHSEKSDDRIVMNVLLNIVETLVSHICVHRPRPRFITVDGGWSLNRQAKKLQRYVEGVWHRTNAYRETASAFRDVLWCGTGFIKVFAEDNQVKIERVFPHEIFVEDAFSLLTKPRSIYQRKWIAAEVLASSYPEHRKEINREAQDSAYGGGGAGKGRAMDLVEVVEAWHLSSRCLDEEDVPEGDTWKEDGRHCVCIKNKTLVDETRRIERLPFAVMKWTEMPLGFLGQGLVEQLQPVQNEVNHLHVRIQQAMQLYATIMTVMDEGAVSKEMITNMIGTIIEKTPGSDFNVFTPPSMNSQVFDHVRWLVDNEYQLSGVSQLSAAGVKPPGIEHGVALRELRDIEASRHGMPRRIWENGHLDLAELTVECARELYEGTDKKQDYQARYVGRRYFEVIDWKDVNLERSKYVLQVWPTNLLPASPAGQLATTQEMIAAGWIDPEVAQYIIDLPDLQKNQSLDNARIEHIDYCCEKMLDKGEYVEPQPWHGILTGIRRVGFHLVQAEIEGAPEDKRKLLRQWIEDAQLLIPTVARAIEQSGLSEFMSSPQQAMMAQQEAEAQEAAAGGGPGGPGGPMPPGPPGATEATPPGGPPMPPIPPA